MIEDKNINNSLIEEPDKQDDKQISTSSLKKSFEKQITNLFIIPKLRKQREKRKKQMNFMDDEIKKKIIKTSEKIPMDIKKMDWNTVFEISLWWKKYSIMNVNLNRHAGWYVEERWISHKRHGEIVFHEINNNPNEKNLKFDKYLKSQEEIWFFMPSEDSVRDILWELWKQAGLDNEKNEIAMLMYLIGIEWNYWLTSNAESWVSLLSCWTWKWDLERQVWSTYWLDGRIILISKQNN